MRNIVFTVGHSIHSIDKFLALIKQHGITAIYDVRSKPYSRRNPQFSKGKLQSHLSGEGIGYEFLGRELGGLSEDPSCYEDGKLKYDRVAETQLFWQGIRRVQEGADQDKIALMCAEKEPLNCHRTILVSRHLESQGLLVQHILEDGALEPHSESIGRLIRQLKLPEPDMFLSQEDIVKEAYKIQGDRASSSKP